jgi:sortase A
VRLTYRILGATMVAAGLGALAWTLVVWQWQDPFTAVLHELEQRELAQGFEQTLAARDASLATAGADDGPATVAAAAAAWRTASGRGDAIARLRIPALDVDEVIVNGTDAESLERGPGRYLGSAMPGEGELVYVAGHRTTYGAPFSDIDKLRKGDRVFVELPYATFEYAVTGHRIVTDDSLWVLRSKGYELLALQACHPRFFATHRYLAYARPVRMTPRGTTSARLRSAPGSS